MINITLPISIDYITGFPWISAISQVPSVPMAPHQNRNWKKHKNPEAGRVSEGNNKHHLCQVVDSFLLRDGHQPLTGKILMLKALLGGWLSPITVYGCRPWKTSEARFATQATHHVTQFVMRKAKSISATRKCNQTRNYIIDTSKENTHTHTHTPNKKEPASKRTSHKQSRIYRCEDLVCARDNT